MDSCVRFDCFKRPANPAPPRSNNGDGNNNVVVYADNWQESQQRGGLEKFSYDEIHLATEGFRTHRILGKGAFGTVYRGFIDGTVRAGYDSREVAIKVQRANTVFGNNMDKMMLREMNCQGKFRHDNIAQVIGFCWDNADRILVYDYMPKRSLDHHIYTSAPNPLTWLQRMRIALGAAKGLDFIYTAETQLVFRDFKTANILLDQYLNAKLSGFGLAREGPTGDQSYVKTEVMGTDGYADPDYCAAGEIYVNCTETLFGHASSKIDVYGFGVVLLEMLAGRKVIDKTLPTKEHDLVKWGRSKLNQDKKLLRLLDSRIRSPSQGLPLAAMEVANLCHKCLRRWPVKRPHMSQVVEKLETVVQTLEAETSQDVAGTNQGEAGPSQGEAGMSAGLRRVRFES